jgi:hypothetical protein
MGNISVTVRVQAYGGKFVGNKMNPTLTVNIVGGGTPVLNQPIPSPSTGTVVQPFRESAARDTIVVQPPSQVAGEWWVIPDPAPGQLTVSFDLEAPSLVEFIATAGPQAVTGMASMFLIPGLQLTGVDPGLVITLHGLAVFTPVWKPATPGTVSISAEVTMMCGCPITPLPAPPGVEAYWPYNEFLVFAQYWGDDGIAGQAAMTCGANSTFAGTITGLTPGNTYNFFVVALQQAETNVGASETITFTA